MTGSKRKWKFTISGLILLIAVIVSIGAYVSDKLYLRAGHAIVTKADMDRKATPDELRFDFQAFTAMVEHVHPNFAAIVDQSEFDAKRTAIMAALNRPMTR